MSRWGKRVTGSVTGWAARWLIALCTLFLVGCDVWCRDRGLDQRARVAAIAVVMTWPYAWYLYGVVYSDALFLAAAVWAMVAIGRDRAVWAGLAGAVASAARPTGVAVIAALMPTNGMD